MKLFRHPDFGQAILRASEHFRGQGLRPAIIEKDYYVTEVLRIVATNTATVIFKGGTSLSKGWNLIRRFSEDIDLFLDPLAFQPALGKNAIDRELKKLRDAVGLHPALTFLENEKPDYRRLRPKRSLLLSAKLRRRGRSSQPRAARSRYRQRAPADDHCPAQLVSQSVPL